MARQDLSPDSASSADMDRYDTSADDGLLDEILVLRSCNGSSQAFGVLVGRYSVRLLRHRQCRACGPVDDVG